MSSFRKLWDLFIDTIKPSMPHEKDPSGLPSVFVTTQPFKTPEKWR